MRVWVASLTLALVAISASGGELITGAAVPTNTNGTATRSGWASSELTDYNRQAFRITDGSGLGSVGTLYRTHSNNPHQTMWLSHNPAGFPALDPNPYVIVDLGAEYLVDSMHIWNYNESGSLTRSVKDLDIRSSTTLGSGGNPPATDTFELEQSLVLLAGTGSGSYEGQRINFDTAFLARYIMLDVNSNFGGDDYGLSEVQFFAVVPEPSSLGVIALGALGLLARRRRGA
jgi:hypothetical protein